jgi:hypothetical protein
VRYRRVTTDNRRKDIGYGRITTTSKGACLHRARAAEKKIVARSSAARAQSAEEMEAVGCAGAERERSSAGQKLLARRRGRACLHDGVEELRGDGGRRLRRRGRGRACLHDGVEEPACTAARAQSAEEMEAVGCAGAERGRISAGQKLLARRRGRARWRRGAWLGKSSSRRTSARRRCVGMRRQRRCFSICERFLRCVERFYIC